MLGLVPSIHVFPPGVRCDAEDVDPRHKAEDDDFVG
jgi:hypothetical protein